MSKNESKTTVNVSLPLNVLSIPCSILSSDEKLVLTSVWSKSKHGQKEIILRNDFISDTYGFSIPKSTRLVKKLVEKGFIKTIKKRNSRTGSVERHVIWNKTSGDNECLIS